MLPPTDAMQLAAKSMSEALQTALLLVDQSLMRAEQQVERRIVRHRRRDDQLADEATPGWRNLGSASKISTNEKHSHLWW